MWISCAFLAIAIFEKAEGLIQNNDHGQYQPQHGGNTYPPAHGGNAYPGEFKYPYGCSHYCQYEASWKYNQYDDSVDFTVKAKVARGYWAGIGFSYVDKLMPESDCYTGHVSNHHHSQKFTFQDRYLFARNSAFIPIDLYQDGHVKSHNYNDGYLTFTFNRKRDTSDHSDVSLKQCVYVLHAWGGQALGEHAISVHKHKVVSTRKVCFGPPQHYPPPPTYHPVPTYHPKPTYHPVPTYHPKPTYHPVPTYHPKPTYHPVPTYHPKPTYHPVPTYHPKPTYHPVPTYYPKPTYHPPYPPAPTYHPVPTYHPKPTYYPAPTYYPKPTYHPPYPPAPTYHQPYPPAPTYHPPYPPVPTYNPFPIPFPLPNQGLCYFKKCKYNEKCQTLFGFAICIKCKDNDHRRHLGGGGGGGKCGSGGGGHDSCDNHPICPPHSTCEIRSGRPSCECDPHYRKVGRKCIRDPRDRCHGYNGCGRHGTCFVRLFKRRCKCDDGYHQVPAGEGICKRKPRRPTFFASGR